MQINLKLMPLIFLILLLIFIFIGENSISAATTGKISGRIYDTETKQPLAGVNVLIEGTTMGAAANANGEYFILNVPPGKYTVIATMMGYETLRQQEVLVQIGLTTTLNFNLNQTAIEGKEVVVIAGRPVIQTDVASSQTILQGSEIKALPVSNFKEVLDKQLGIRSVDMRGLFIRGQRQNYVSLTVDGMETRDNIDDQIYTRFNPDELEQVEINAGGFDVAYGNASAGIITLVTKEGGKKYFGTFDYRQSIPARKHFGLPLKDYWDKYFLEGWSDSEWDMRAFMVPSRGPYGGFKNRPEMLKEYYRWVMRDEATKYGHKSDLVLSTTFGGPIPFLKNTSLFASYRREKNYYVYPGPIDHFFDQNAMAKVTTHLTPNMKLSFNFRYIESIGANTHDKYRSEDVRDLSEIDPKASDQVRYQMEGVEQVARAGFGWPYTGHMATSTRFYNQYGLTFTHTLSSRTFYEVKLMANYFRSFAGPSSYLRDTTATKTFVDPEDPDYTVTLGGPYAMAPIGFWPIEFSDPLGMTMGSTDGSCEQNYARDITLKANLTSQIDKINQINIGLQYTYYDIKKEENWLSPPDRDDIWKWHVFPQTFAFWASDKLEFQGMVLDLGVRGDLRVPDEWLDIVNHPWDWHWSTVSAVHPDSNMSGPRYNPPLKLALTPRLKISHPIGEDAKIFFNWGHYYQDPPFDRQYRYFRRGAALEGNGMSQFGTPELPYIKSVQYEIGYEHNVFDIFRIATSGYYKDVSNLIIDRVGMDGKPRVEEPVLAEPDYRIDMPARYLSSQGFELRLEKRVGRFWTAWLNFNYEAYTRGVFGYEIFYEDTTQRPEPWDYREENVKRAPESRFNFGLDIHTPGLFGPRVLGFHPLADMNLNFLLWWRQQPAESYNPFQLTGVYEPRDNIRWKPHWALNMAFNKRFEFDKFITPVLYVEVYNLLNTKNMFRGIFYENDASLNQYLDAVKEAGDKPGERPDLVGEIIGNQPLMNKAGYGQHGTIWCMYLNPRQIWLGIRFEIN